MLFSAHSGSDSVEVPRVNPLYSPVSLHFLSHEHICNQECKKSLLIPDLRQVNREFTETGQNMGNVQERREVKVKLKNMWKLKVAPATGGRPQEAHFSHSAEPKQAPPPGLAPPTTV